MEPVLFTTIAAVLMGLLTNFFAHFIKDTVAKYMKKSDAEKIKITSSSGESLNIEVKKNMSEEEIRLLLNRITELEKKSNKAD